MTAECEDVYARHAARIKELAAGKNCIVCNHFRTKKCPQHASGITCDKWEYYLGKPTGES